MAVLSKILVLASIASVFASPVSYVDNVGPGMTSVGQVRDPNHVHNVALGIFKTYLKFGAQPPQYLKDAVAVARAAFSKRDTGSVTASPSDSLDDSYLCPVSIGTPGQVLNLDFDTGSSDLWVFSSETPSSETTGQAEYDPSKSSTSTKLSGYTWEISYGDGSSSSGDVYTDVVNIGGVSATKQAVELAQQVSDQFTQDSSTDGLVGLAFSGLNTVSPRQQTTFFDTIKSSLSSPVFTADLKHQAPGKYNFGYIDTAAYTGAISYVNVDSSQGYWGWTSSGYAVGSGAFKKTSISGIADTGTTLLYLPASVNTAYYGSISGASNSRTYGGYIFPCKTTIPSFTFGVGNARITIPASYMNAGPVDTAGKNCFGGLQDSSSIGINIFGDVALKAAFVVFNGGSTPTLGWANKTLS